MKTLLDIVDRRPEPAPWSEGDNIPWHDPGFSERMLAEHLSQDHDLASRRSATIDRQVEWIFREVLRSRPARVLDLGCGPGFYSHRLAARGCECVGIDFSPASIRYAQQEAARHKGLACSYRLGDLRHEPFGEGFDLVMLVYGQFNVFPRSQAREILKNASAALESEGALLLEIQSSEQVRAAGEQGPGWYTSASGLFSHRPHLVLQENFWNPEAQASTIRFIHIDAQSGKVESHVLSNEAYSEAELDEALKAAGFHEIRRFPSLSGTGTEASTDLPVVVASRCSVGAESRFPVG